MDAQDTPRALPSEKAAWLKTPRDAGIKKDGDGKLGEKNPLGFISPRMKARTSSQELSYSCFSFSRYSGLMKAAIVRRGTAENRGPKPITKPPPINVLRPISAGRGKRFPSFVSLRVTPRGEGLSIAFIWPQQK